MKAILPYKLKIYIIALRRTVFWNINSKLQDFKHVISLEEKGKKILLIAFGRKFCWKVAVANSFLQSARSQQLVYVSKSLLGKEVLRFCLISC